MKNAYRETKDAPAPASANNQLTCWLSDGDKNRWLRVAFVKTGATLVVCAMVSAADSYLVTLLFLTVGLFWIYRGFRARKGPAVTFRVDKHRVHVERDGATILETALDHLLDVRLDTKSTTKDVTTTRADGVNSIFGMSSGYSVSLDLSRIELVTRTSSVWLREDFISSSPCTEQLSAIRRFLRAQGWKPADERT